MIPSTWLPRVSMSRFIGHWTAGGHRANPTDLKAYHFVWEGDGTPRRGVDVRLNSGGLKNGYAAHTLNANGNAIGGSMCGMMGSRESPFNPGPAPLTKVQWDAFVRDSTAIIAFYGIPIGRRTTLFHAEVQETLGITQRNKWDVIRLPFDPSVRGAKAVGDKWRDEMKATFSGTVPDDDVEPIPAGGTAVTTANTLNVHNGPGASNNILFTLSKNSVVEVLDTSGDWAQIKTQQGHLGWVAGRFLKMIDGPRPLEPSKPDPRRLWITQARSQLDKLEKALDNEE